MGANVLPLVIPLLAAGFLFVAIFYPTRYLAASSEGQRLFFLCSASGIVISAIGFPLFRLIAPTSAEQWAGEQYGAAIVAPLLFTIGLAVVGAVGLNLVIWCVYRFVGPPAPTGRHEPTWTWVYALMAARSGDPMQRMLVEAATSLGPGSGPRDRLVLLTLSSRKVYCGFVIEVAPMHRADDRYVRMIPVFSATRHKDSLRFSEQIDYPVVHYWRIQRTLQSVQQRLTALAASGTASSVELAKLRQERDDLAAAVEEFADSDPATRLYLDSVDIHDWIKVIPLAEVETASFHDEVAYRQWFSKAPDPTSPEAAG
jgi:hypothetical protein